MPGLNSQKEKQFSLLQFIMIYLESWTSRLMEENRKTDLADINLKYDGMTMQNYNMI